MENQTNETTDPALRSVSAILRQAAQRLISCGIESGALDAEILLAHALGIAREQLVAALRSPVDDRNLRAFKSLLSRRIKREPTAYITGRREFWSLDFRITPGVLIPRPETELLVETVFELATEWRSAGALRILELGTGSGAIAVALASELKSAEIVATDISAEALAVARGNAVRNDVAGRIKFVEGDLFEPLAGEPRVDFIVFNPPYIRHADIIGLEPEISRWEPRGALDGGVDGLDYYRRTAAKAGHHLSAQGVVAVEVGAGMGRAVAELFQEAEYSSVSIADDYAGRDRVVVARRASLP